MGFSATRTMQIAQKLYEGLNVGSEVTGLITYMRTDGVQMSMEAVHALRGQIQDQYGGQITCLKNHDFIKVRLRTRKKRMRRSDQPISSAHRRKCVPIWIMTNSVSMICPLKRAMASQFASAQLDQTAIELASQDDAHVMRATGSVIVFDGFLNLYFESRDDGADGDDKDVFYQKSQAAMLSPSMRRQQSNISRSHHRATQMRAWLKN